MQVDYALDHSNRLNGWVDSGSIHPFHFIFTCSPSELSSRRKNRFFPRGAGTGSAAQEKGSNLILIRARICRITAHYVTKVGWNWADLCLIRGRRWRYLCHIMRRDRVGCLLGQGGVAFNSVWWGAGGQAAKEN